MTNDLSDKSISLIIADPPYYNIKGEFDFIWDSFESYLNDVEKWAKECKRVLKDNGTLFWYGHAKNIAYSQIIFDKYFGLVNNIVWHKKDCQTKRNSPDAVRSFMAVTERILMYSNENDGLDIAKNDYNYQLGKRMTEIMEPIVSYMIGEMERAGLNVREVNKLTGTCMGTHWFARTSQWALPTEEWYIKLREIFNQNTKKELYLKKDYEYLKKDYEYLKKDYAFLKRPFNTFGKIYTDVLEFSQEACITKYYNHETVKPETLTRLLILSCSRFGDTILVPFAGSGTECAMAIKEKRNFIGYDVNKDYVNMANERCKRQEAQFQMF